VATAVLVLLHTPPPVASATLIPVPAHRLTGPVMVLTDGKALTVTGIVAKAVHPGPEL
jgi:hypothetical protein